jgi:hypothetical protein
LGDYKLKTSPNYVVPPEQRINTQRKREQLVILRQRIAGQRQSARTPWSLAPLVSLGLAILSRADAKSLFNNHVRQLMQLKVSTLGRLSVRLAFCKRFCCWGPGVH